MDAGMTEAKAALALASAALFVACVAGQPGGGGGNCAHRIAYIVAGSGADHGSDSAAGWDGVRAGADALGLDEACATFVVLVGADDLHAQVDALVADGHDIIVTDGFALRDVTRQTARQHPQAMFIGIDQSQTGENGQPDPVENLAGLVFHEEVEGFLAGALAGLLTETDVVGGIFGCEVIPPTIRYRVGFRNGALATNPDVDVRIATHPGSLDVCFFDPQYGRREASDLLDQGVDVVFVAARQTGEGALPVVCEAGLAAIVLTGRDCAIASVNRDVAGGVRDLIVAVGDGTFTAGDTFGQVTLHFLQQAQESVPAGVKGRLDEILEALLAGKIDPCASPDDGAFCTDIR